MVLNNKQLKEISGGEFNLGLALLIGSAITFITGIVDGFLRPIKCN